MEPDPILENNLKKLLKTRIKLMQPSPEQTKNLLLKLKKEAAPFSQQFIFPNSALGMLTGVMALGLGLGGLQFVYQPSMSAEPLNILFLGFSLANLITIPFFTILIIQNRRKQTHENMD